MAALETPKKGVMYVYKLATAGSLKPDSKHLPEKKAGWGGLRRSKTYRESERGGLRGEVEAARKSVSIVESRKSVSHVETTNVASVAAFLQVKVLVTDMPVSMQVHAFRCARGTYDSLEKFSSKQMAYNMKKEFDKVYGPAWHCIVGSSFGSFVTHSTGGFLYFSMEKLYILVFKTKVQKTLD
ncbi:hypothetical protein RJ640_018101 [Escallonia rubra]|uniref:Dynein light chain n=1 Tax=Escallonia rubra TaxID=112253 RepID=A0AA88QNX9_9ASTE|nr:hypothetical protein RJ640_018101 [Escallonia rubra]